MFFLTNTFDRYSKKNELGYIMFEWVNAFPLKIKHGRLSRLQQPMTDGYTPMLAFKFQ